jgi:peptide/nickel transport system permease protein
MQEFDKMNTVLELKKVYKKKSQLKEIWRRLKKNRMAVAGLVIIVCLFAVAICADIIADWDDVVVKQNIPERLQKPSKEHWFGTDEYGRDIFARIIHGTRVSIQVGFISITISLILGGILGSIAGFFGDKIDNLIMRLMDIFLAMPNILLAIAIVSALGSSIPNLMIALGIANTPKFTRVVRAAVITVKDQEYIEAARAIGARNHTIIMHHILNNCMAPIIVQATFRVATAILTTSSLSFLGLGIQPPAPEWGAMLASGRTYIRDYSYMLIFPGLAIMLTILSLNSLGDGLRDALDPRLK